MTTATTKRPKLTAEEATTFDRFSVSNAVHAAHELRASGACAGTCEPYQDIFTYARWQAQGGQVRKGQHGVKLPIILHAVRTDRDGQEVAETYRQTTTVFCRCQVDQKGEVAYWSADTLDQLIHRTASQSSA